MAFFLSLRLYLQICNLAKIIDLTQAQNSVFDWLGGDLVTKLCLPLETPQTVCSLPGFSVHRILQARILEWVAISFSRGSSRPRDRTQTPALQAESLPTELPGNWLRNLYKRNCFYILYCYSFSEAKILFFFPSRFFKMWTILLKVF